MQTKMTDENIVSPERLLELIQRMPTTSEWHHEVVLALRELRALRDADTVRVPRAWALAAMCPECNGEGFTVRPGYPDGEPVQAQCRWCDERHNLGLDAILAGGSP